MSSHRSIVGTAVLAWMLLVGAAVASARTFYVDSRAGSDENSTAQAQSAASPWQSIKKALGTAAAGDVILVQPGTYAESVSSKRDGTPSAPVVLKSAQVGAAAIQPPAVSVGFLVYHNHQVIDGFAISGATTGIKAGPHLGNNADPIVGLLVQNNRISGNTSNGIQFTNGLAGEIAFNTITQNGANGINYDGSTSLIHDNVVKDNGQFGIYVKSGVDHLLYANQVQGNAGGNLQILGTLLAVQRTYYVDAAAGSNAYTAEHAQSPATPWQTIKTAIGVAQPGDTIVVLPGVYAESVESKRDGTAANPITLRAATPGTVVIQPPGGSNGFVVQHHYHTIDGFAVSGALNGLQLGPHDGNSNQPIYGLVAVGNRVSGSVAVGIKFTNADGGKAMHNVVSGSGQEGILYGSTGAAVNATILNNLVYGNGLNNQGKFGIALGGGAGHQVVNNTVYGNAFGGILLGQSSSLPVSAAVLNNIVAGNGSLMSAAPSSPNGAGIAERLADSYVGQSVLDYNDVHGNGVNYKLNPVTGTVPGPNSISAPPGFVDAAGGDFRLGRVASGQSADSPCIDRGSDTAAAVGLTNRTAFTDRYADAGGVDLGYHGTLLYPSQGTLTVSQILMHLDPASGGDDFYVTMTLQPGAGSDGIEPGVSYAEVSLGSLVFPLPIRGFTRQGTQWIYTGQAGAVTSAMLQKQSDGSVSAVVQGAGLNLLFNDAPTTVQLRIGDDFGAATVPLRGTLLYP